MVVVDEDGATVAVDATSAASVDAVGASAREASAASAPAAAVVGTGRVGLGAARSALQAAVSRPAAMPAASNRLNCSTRQTRRPSRTPS